MDNLNTSINIKDLINTNSEKELKKTLASYLPGEAADLILYLPKKKRLSVFMALPEETAAKTFELLPFGIQKEILGQLPDDRAAQILNALSPDDRTEFFEELPSSVVKELLKLLNTDERKLTLQILGYPEKSVGRLMTPEYIAVRPDWTVKEVLDFVRTQAHYSETIDMIYVIDDHHKLIDDIRLKNFLFASPEAHVKDLCDYKYVFLNVNDDEESAINVFRKYNRAALPVTDSKGILLGIVTMDDILHLANREFTEDVQKMGAVEALDEPYMDTPFLELMKKRAGWLTVLFIGEMFTATAMGYFEGEIAKAVVLALFLPLIISSGGNSGSQASSLIIRALALGEVTLKDWWKIMRREIFSGLFLGSVLGVIGFFRVVVWSQFTNLYGEHWLLIGTTIGFALIGVVLWGTITGSMLPLILKRCGADPAVSSAPFVATLIDVTGIVIYFTVALLFLTGTLL